MTDQNLSAHSGVTTDSGRTSKPGAKPAASSWLAPLLAFVAGFVDTAGFVVLGGLFLAHVTGNFVVLGAQLQGRGGEDVVEKLSVLPIFVVGVALAWFLQRRFTSRAAFSLAVLETALLVGALGAAAVMERNAGGSAITRWVLITSGVLAMGVQAMLGRVGKLPMTTVMTGNVTQTTTEALGMIVEGKKSTEGLRAGVLLVGAFALGAACAGLGLRFGGAVSLLLPIAAMAAVCAIFAQERPG
ncbi:MAG: DUF1275 domain-containing protein [Phycisphaerales bacterium]|nr:DUF1275 domain-containing protein [Phycisphaerales bacterium]